MDTKDENESKHAKSGPITVRKDYTSEEDIDKKNSFRKYVLQNRTENESPEQRIDKNDDANEEDSLLQGLPASMKKIRELSMDKSRHSINDIDQAFKDEKDEKDAGEVDFNLKFFNKKTIKSLGSRKMSQHQKSSSHAVLPMKKRSRFKSRQNSIKHTHSQTPDVKIKRKKTSMKNVSFDGPSEVFHEEKQVGNHEKPLLQYNQPIDYIDNEIESQMMRETLSQMIPEKRQEIYPEEEPNYHNSQSRNIESDTVRRQQQELELERMRLERSEMPRQTQIKPEAQVKPEVHIPTIENKIMANRSRSQNQRPIQTQTQPQETLPAINYRRNSNGSKSF